MENPEIVAVKRAQVLYLRIADLEREADSYREKVKDCQKRIDAFNAEIKSIIRNPTQLTLIPGDAAPAASESPATPATVEAPSRQ